ncbi:MAG: hypothetical protein IK117_04615, partial [Bacteroidales bacterium]|nr:hypothetical protein [Bacteroidales bacterium]
LYLYLEKSVDDISTQVKSNLSDGAFSFMNKLSFLSFLSFAMKVGYIELASAISVIVAGANSKYPVSAFTQV